MPFSCLLLVNPLTATQLAQATFQHADRMCSVRCAVNDLRRRNQAHNELGGWNGQIGIARCFEQHDIAEPAVTLWGGLGTNPATIRNYSILRNSNKWSVA